jgi:hypothetical protein
MKPKSQLITAACVAALVFCGPSFAFAASKKSASPSPSPAASASPAAAAKTSESSASKAPRAIPFKGAVSSVDQSAKTFAVAGKEASRTFKATDKTTITKDGKAATFADFADGDKVTGSYWKQDDGTLELKSLKIGGKAETASTEKAEKPAKKSKKGDAAADTAASPSASPKK